MAKIEGDSANNTLNGTANDDEIFGSGGNDTLNGGDGNDVIEGDVIAGNQINSTSMSPYASTYLLTMNDGSIVEIYRSYVYNRYDLHTETSTTGNPNDGIVGVNDINSNLNANEAIHKFVSSSGQDFKLEIGDAETYFLTTEDGSVHEIYRSYIYENFDRYTITGTTGNPDDGIVDIDAIAANLNAGNAIHKFESSSGQDFTIKAGTAETYLITLESGEVIEIYRSYVFNQFETYTTTGTTGGVDDGIIDVDAIAANLNADNAVHQFTSSSGQDFEISAGTENTYLITLQDGSILEIYRSYVYNQFEYYTTTGTTGGADDGIIDVDALAANLNSENAIHQFVSSSGQDFQIIPGGDTTYLVILEDGTVLDIYRSYVYDNFDRYSLTSTTGSPNDGIVDIDAIAANLNVGNAAHQFISSSGQSFQITAGSDETYILTLENGDVIELYRSFVYSNFDSYSLTSTTGNPDDGIIDVDALAANLNANEAVHQFVADSDNPELGNVGGDGIPGDDIIDGGVGNDIIRGNGGNDTISGGTGDDQIEGNEGNDIINGGTGADRLEGNEGNDKILTAAGDLAFGGSGDDIFRVDSSDPSSATITITGGEDGETAGDTLNLSGLQNVTVFESSPGAESGYVLYDNDAGDQVRIDYTEIENINLICLARGTRITTADGEIPIEDLKEGDLVKTMDNGLQKIRWINSSKVPAVGDLAPIRIKASTLGNYRDLYVSPLHRMLFSNYQTDLLFSEQEVLISAKFLIDDDNIQQVEGGEVEYFHILFDKHEIMFANGSPTESFHPGTQAMSALEEEIRDEIYSLFPELRADISLYGEAARCTLLAHEVTVLRSVMPLG